MNGLRTKRKDESPKLMPLPQLLQTDQAHAGQFVEFLVTTPADLDSSTRVASLSPLGVNLLLQRWVYHNSRVVIPIQTYAEQTIGPYDEADLAEEWITERVPVLTPQDAHAEFDAWLRQPANGGDTTRQARLNQRQSASMVRKEASARLKALTEQTPE